MTASRACALVVFLLPSLPLYASGAGAPTIKLVKGECVAEVELTRASLRGGSIDYAVSIRHDAPTGLANVTWKYAIDYVGNDGAPYTLSDDARLGDARSDQTLRARPVNGPQVPVREITGYKVTDTTCSYTRPAKSEK